ncbi:sugar ABC transporter permease [Desmospora profundinema]|uniref:Arabinogalactan oligomer/maltooligosaccharide transport system permease protein n=1 Tax=Desmospora profundinema TaxID=1571184 RepID=A0ABU1IJN0_9BACL|nr:sugar ABC transporter permease [Desmospora profundinema]MDR6224963.1 arabinogalactan oligomer/maltooligosaccharide transport system permease protein [Desmospora profundinema]
MTHRMKSNIGLILTYAILMVMVVVTLFPIVWTIGASLNPGTSLFSTQLIPEKASFTQYQYLLTDPNSQYLTWYKNSLKISFYTAVFSVLLTSITAYAFSRFQFIGRRYTLMAFLVLQMFPSLMAMVAFYVLLNMVGLLDSHWGLILIYLGGQIPFNAWLMKGYMDTIPRGLDEAARIDGANHLTVFFRIILPLCTPIIAVVFLFNFMAPMMDFLLPQIVLTSPENKTLAVGLFDMIRDRFGQNYTRFAAGSVMVALPIAAVYLALQRYFISGLTSGATKG